MNCNYFSFSLRFITVISMVWIPPLVFSQVPIEQDSIAADTAVSEIEDTPIFLEPRRVVKPAPESEIQDIQPAEEIVPSVGESNHFEFLKTLQDEEVKQLGSRLRRIGTSANEVLDYRLKEYNIYLDIYFPNAHSAEVLDFIIQNAIRQENWEKFEAAVSKFLYLYPQSQLKGSVLTQAIEQIKSVRAFKANQEKILTQWKEIPVIKGWAERYFGYVSYLHERQFRTKSIFTEEAWAFLSRYPDSPDASAVLLWLAKLNHKNEAFQESYSIYNKLLSLYPDNPEVATALYQKAKLEQVQFSEYKKAISSLRQFLVQLPEDSLSFDVQFRLATVSDQNLNDWVTAIEEYEVLAQKYPETKEAIKGLMRMGEIQNSKLNQLEEAIETYHRVATSYSEQKAVAVQAYTTAGEIYEKRKDYEKAIAEYLLIHDNYPGTDEDLNILEKCALIYQKRLKNNDKASEVLTMIVDGFPESKNAAKAKKTLAKLNK